MYSCFSHVFQNHYQLLPLSILTMESCAKQILAVNTVSMEDTSVYVDSTKYQYQLALNNISKRKQGVIKLGNISYGSAFLNKKTCLFKKSSTSEEGGRSLKSYQLHFLYLGPSETIKYFSKLAIEANFSLGL